MSRLFYESDITVNTATTIPRMSFQVRGKRDSKQYLEKVAKLIPSEIIAGYLTLIGFVPLIRNSTLWPWVYGSIFTICLALTPLYMYLQADKGRPKRIHILVSSIAFVVWAYAISGGAIVGRAHDPALASILLVIFSLISGAVPLNH